MDTLREFVLATPQRIAMPLAVYPGAALTGVRVRDMVTDPRAQSDASVALHRRYRTRFLLSAMDLSVEAEAFGCPVQMSEDEIPTVAGSFVTTPEQARALAVPKPGDRRTRVYLETAALLRKVPGKVLVLAGCIGPFSLAGRLTGLSEACGLTMTDPDLMHLLLQKCAQFLSSYAKAFKATGADGLVMAEPAAGLLSPRGMACFSSAYVKQIIMSAQDDRFTFILHNCGARLAHLPAVLESGAKVLHFGSPMDIVGALAKAGPDVVLCGNLDPTAIFLQSTPEQVAARTEGLLDAARPYRNFVISSGCDVPRSSPLANLNAFFETTAKERSHP
jgi:uroporphyrinogen decarboxylase